MNVRARCRTYSLYRAVWIIHRTANRSPVAVGATHVQRGVAAQGIARAASAEVGDVETAAGDEDVGWVLQEDGEAVGGLAGEELGVGKC